MALSLPISAFNDVDDNKNDLVSMIEFNKHRAEIVSLILSGVVLSEKGDDRFLQAAMLSPVPLDEHSTSIDAAVARVYVMGRFVLKNTATDLRFRNDLYGDKPSERSFKISARRKSAQKNDTFELTPTVSSIIIFEEKSIYKRFNKSTYTLHIAYVRYRLQPF